MGLELTGKNFRMAELIIEKESINPLTKDKMFPEGIYCILSSSENHEKQLNTYYKLLNRGLDTPEAILDKVNAKKLWDIIKKARFPNSKRKYILRFSEFWLESEIPRRILDDANNGRQYEFELRDELAKKAPGMGRKCASFFMQKCGYENLVPVDIWVLRFLEDKGYEVKIPDYRTVGGLTKKEYLEYEKIISGMAGEYNVSPVIFQAYVWGKYSKWSKLYAPDQTTFDRFYNP